MAAADVVAFAAVAPVVFTRLAVAAVAAAEARNALLTDGVFTDAAELR